MDLLTIIKTDWHKIVVAILALIQSWKFLNKHIKSIYEKDKRSAEQTMSTNQSSINLILPKEGCTITIKPLDKL